MRKNADEVFAEVTRCITTTKRATCAFKNNVARKREERERGECDGGGAGGDAFERYCIGAETSCTVLLASVGSTMLPAAQASRIGACVPARGQWRGGWRRACADWEGRRELPNAADPSSPFLHAGTGPSLQEDDALRTTTRTVGLRDEGALRVMTISSNTSSRRPSEVSGTSVCESSSSNF